ncbi:hypothetical protein [Pedobacter sp. HMWF019]|uniref:hypothetical protein n=1 Tax=Pedobacter sp. HMWF019 TaxID=2056856 RepID=UPI0013049EBD|nr:hypothetical protein [Pedobacter sp. HMWF019]
MSPFDTHSYPFYPVEIHRAQTTGTVKKGRRQNEHNSTTTTSNSKTKKIKGVLMKYN